MKVDKPSNGKKPGENGKPHPLPTPPGHANITRGRAMRITRSWLGTPYRHQSALRGAGCDCLGLLRGVWRELYGSEPEIPPPYSPDWDEVAKREVLFAAARRHLVERPGQTPRGADVILFRMRKGGVAKHLGIASGETGFIHSFSGHGVVESALTQPWKRRVAGVFAFPGLD